MGKSDTLSWRSDHGTSTRDNQDLTLLTPGLFAMRPLEGLQVAGEEKDIFKEIRCGMDIEDQAEVVVMLYIQFSLSPLPLLIPSLRSRSRFYHISVYARSCDFFYSCFFFFSVPYPCLQFSHFRSPISVHSICSLFLFLFLVSFDTWFITFYLNPILILARPDFVYKLSMSIVVWQFVNYLIPLSISSPITSSYSLLFKVNLY